MDAKAAEKAAGPSPERLDFEEQFQGPPGPLPLVNELDQLLAPSDLQVVSVIRGVVVWLERRVGAAYRRLGRVRGAVQDGLGSRRQVRRLRPFRSASP